MLFFLKAPSVSISAGAAARARLWGSDGCGLLFVVVVCLCRRFVGRQVVYFRFLSCICVSFYIKRHSRQLKGFSSPLSILLLQGVARGKRTRTRSRQTGFTYSAVGSLYISILFVLDFVAKGGAVRASLVFLVLI